MLVGIALQAIISTATDANSQEEKRKQFGSKLT
jgi:hypothetical protein